VWSGPKVIYSHGQKNLMQYVLFEVHDVNHAGTVAHLIISYKN